MKINMRENPMFTCIDINLNIRSALFIIVQRPMAKMFYLFLLLIILE